MAGGSVTAFLAQQGSSGRAENVSSDNPLPVGGQVGGLTIRPSASFVRPADTTAYAVGDLVANNTSAGSVTPMSFTVGRDADSGGMIRRIRLRKTGTSVSNALFRLHLYSASPTPSNGDNGAWLTNQAASLTLGNAFGVAMGWGPNNFSVRLEKPSDSSEWWGLMGWFDAADVAMIESTDRSTRLQEADPEFSEANFDDFKSVLICSVRDDATGHFQDILTANGLQVPYEEA